MVDATAVKAKLDAVFARDDLKRNIVVNHYTLTDNSFGEPELVFGSQEVFDGIIVNYRANKYQFDPVGDFPNSEFIIYLSVDDTVGKDDIIDMFSSEYVVEGIDKFPLGDLLVAQMIFVKEKQD